MVQAALLLGSHDLEDSIVFEDLWWEKMSCIVYGKSHWDNHYADPRLLQWKIICLLKNASVLLGLARDKTCLPRVMVNFVCQLGQAYDV